MSKLDDADTYIRACAERDIKIAALKERVEALESELRALRELEEMVMEMFDEPEMGDICPACGDQYSKQKHLGKCIVMKARECKKPEGK